MFVDGVDVLLVAPPRLMWPYINAYDNFMVPQNLPCLAGYIRAKGIKKVAIIDCMPLKMGWKTLIRTIKNLKPKILAAGENHALFSVEVLKLFRYAKEILPDIVTVAGGTHFSFLAEDILKNEDSVDYIVIGEGEETFLELCQAILSGCEKKDMRKVKGIAFKDDGEIVITEPRPLIKNLDDLPIPAYDLLPMDKYGKSKYLFASWGSTIHHSRGCTSSCDFCSFWIQMADVKIQNGKKKLIPRWRTKSPERTFEEVKYLVKNFGRYFLVWVDDTFNVNPKWEDEFSELILKSNTKTRWYCFMRADYILRDEELGIMEKLVKAGLQHISIGAERAEDEDFTELNKPFYSTEILSECINLIREKYPHVFVQMTFLTGLRNDSRKTFRKILEFAKKLSPDYAGFHPITPFPGTKLYEQYKEYIELTDWNYYDLNTPVMGTKYLQREEVEELTAELYRKFVNLKWFLKGILGGDYRRKMYIWWLIVTMKITLSSIFNLKMPFNEYHNLIYPPWYYD